MQHDSSEHYWKVSIYCQIGTNEEIQNALSLQLLAERGLCIKQAGWRLCSHRATEESYQIMRGKWYRSAAWREARAVKGVSRRCSTVSTCFLNQDAHSCSYYYRQDGAHSCRNVVSWLLVVEGNEHMLRRALEKSYKGRRGLQIFKSTHKYYNYETRHVWLKFYSSIICDDTISTILFCY